MTAHEYLTGLLRATEVPRTAVALPKAKRTVEVLTILREERSWAGPVPASLRSIPNKPALQFDGQPTWAEFILLRLLEGDGWNGAWVKNWHGLAFWRNACEVVELSLLASALFRQIQKRLGGRGGGGWDILASRGDEVLFIESKQHKRDRLGPTQKIWIESALDEGVPLSSFAIVEWRTLPEFAT